MENRETLIRLLRERFAHTQATRRSYSMRAFARDLQIPVPVISEVMRGKRSLTKKLGQKFCEALSLSPAETTRYLSHLEVRSTVTKDNYVQIEQDHFNVISDWYYFAILSLIETEDFSSSSGWIAKRLGISIKQVDEALKTLKRLDLIQVKNNKLMTSGKMFSTTHDIPNSAIKKNHIQGLELAHKALLDVAVERREFSANTLCLDESELKEVKNLLRKLRSQFVKKAETGRKQSVYRLQIQLFPLTLTKDIL